jgi:pimeloyl-ACP methyl ester carboxylesterase
MESYLDRQPMGVLDYMKQVILSVGGYTTPVPQTSTTTEKVVVFVGGFTSYGDADKLHQTILPHGSVLVGPNIYTPTLGPFTSVTHRVERLAVYIRQHVLPRAEHFHFIGHSFGAATILELVVRYPDLLHHITSVSLVSPMLGGYGPLRACMFDTVCRTCLPLVRAVLITAWYLHQFVAWCRPFGLKLPINLDLGYGPLKEYLQGEHTLLQDSDESTCRARTDIGLDTFETHQIPVRTWATDYSVPVQYPGFLAGPLTPTRIIWLLHPTTPLILNLVLLCLSGTHTTDCAQGWGPSHNTTLMPGPHDGLLLVESQLYQAHRTGARIMYVHHVDSLAASTDISQQIHAFMSSSSHDVDIP